MYFISLPQFVDLVVISLTIAGEGIGEPWGGKVWIADTIHNYASIHKLTIRETCLLRKPNRYSCWDKPSELIAKRDGFKASAKAWKDCLILARQLCDGTYYPMSTSTHYYNPKLVKKVPSFYGKLRYVRDVGNHKFFSEIINRY
jgi:hypothetical protein